MKEEYFRQAVAKENWIITSINHYWPPNSLMLTLWKQLLNQGHWKCLANFLIFWLISSWLEMITQLLRNWRQIQTQFESTGLRVSGILWNSHFKQVSVLRSQQKHVKKMVLLSLRRYSRSKMRSILVHIFCWHSYMSCWELPTVSWLISIFFISVFPSS